MKALTCLILLFFMLSSTRIYSQPVPDKAVDISPLLIGEKIPRVSIVDTNGRRDSLHLIIARKPAVLIFYRGGWCPYCNLQLAALQEIEKDVLTLGYQIIAISPDSPENLKDSMDKHKLNYRLYSDADMHIARQFGIAFTVATASQERLTKSSGGLNPGLLPVPSVFVLNTEGEILFEYINPDYKKRLSGNLLLSVLKSLK